MIQREQVLREALSLPPEDRAYVAAALEESLSATHAPESSAADLLAELQRRSAALRAGTTSARPAHDILDDQRRAHVGEGQA
jgi:hypothetical protein